MQCAGPSAFHSPTFLRIQSAELTAISVELEGLALSAAMQCSILEQLGLMAFPCAVRADPQCVPYISMCWSRYNVTLTEGLLRAVLQEVDQKAAGRMGDRGSRLGCRLAYLDNE